VSGDSDSTILVNALSVNNQSGGHVLAGHVEQLVASGLQVCVVARCSTAALRRGLSDSVTWINAPERTTSWFFRWVWETLFLPRVARRIQADWYFTPSGIASSRLRMPQAVLCQNPWCMVASARRKRDAFKAWLQRRAYRKTMRIAEVMVFNSTYMQKAYRANAGFDEKRGIIAYQAAEESTRRRAEAWKTTKRNPGQICCVSAMAPHKNVEALLRAVKKLKERNVETLKERNAETLKDAVSRKESSFHSFNLAAFQSFSLSEFQQISLRLVGSWPDSRYEAKIRRLVGELGLSDCVHFDGFVSREELDRIYAESQVYALLSRCESFGIPAIEAQLFGTPVVGSTACAVPEICGEGGLFCDPDDVDGVAAALFLLLSDQDTWTAFSTRARLNAERFRWEGCSRPLVDLFKGVRACT
jgi:glycosyltransferase involved in cell wall biosynthesis